MTEQCNNCRFYRRGECRRYPPVTVKTGDHYYDVKNERPQVSPSTWCGEWQDMRS